LSIRFQQSAAAVVGDRRGLRKQVTIDGDAGCGHLDHVAGLGDNRLQQGDRAIGAEARRAVATCARFGSESALGTELD
jgi:hypothetical protein